MSSAKQSVDSQYAERLWEMFKTVDGSNHVISPEAESYIKNSGAGVDTEQATSIVRLLGKAAAACKNVDEFKNVLDKQEFPPIKLTPKEMSFVKGGLVAKVINVAVMPVKLATSTVKLGSVSGVSSAAAVKANAGSGAVSSGTTVESGSCHGRSD